MKREPALQQPESFAFDSETMRKARDLVKKYPDGRQASAVIPLLDIVQRQAGGWLPVKAMEAVAEFLDMAYIRVYEVATFYSMFNIQPVGQHLIQVCRTTPCWLRGSDVLTSHCKNKLGIGKGETTPDGKFTLVEVECLGACVNAPMVQINDDYYEDLSTQLLDTVLDTLASGKKPKIGTQVNRKNSAPEGGLTTLKAVGEK